MWAGRSKASGIRPVARFVAYSNAGCLPEEMRRGPVYAIPKALKLAGLTLDQIDLIERSPRCTGVGGNLTTGTGSRARQPGAVALGHPLGCTDAKSRPSSCTRCGAAERSME